MNLNLGPLEQLPMELQLRQGTLPWGGVVTLLSDCEVCRDSDVLIPEQACVLQLLGYEVAESKVTIKYMWDVQSGRFP